MRTTAEDSHHRVVSEDSEAVPASEEAFRRSETRASELLLATEVQRRLRAGQLSHCWICFVLNNLNFFRPNHVLASQFCAAGEGFSFNVTTFKLP